MKTVNKNTLHGFLHINFGKLLRLCPNYTGREARIQEGYSICQEICRVPNCLWSLSELGALQGCVTLTCLGHLELVQLHS